MHSRHAYFPSTMAANSSGELIAIDEEQHAFAQELLALTGRTGDVPRMRATNALLSAEIASLRSDLAESRRRNERLLSDNQRLRHILAVRRGSALPQRVADAPGSSPHGKDVQFGPQKLRTAFGMGMWPPGVDVNVWADCGSLQPELKHGGETTGLDAFAVLGRSGSSSEYRLGERRTSMGLRVATTARASAQHIGREVSREAKRNASEAALSRVRTAAAAAEKARRIEQSWGEELQRRENARVAWVAGLTRGSGANSPPLLLPSKVASGSGFSSATAGCTTKHFPDERAATSSSVPSATMIFDEPPRLPGYLASCGLQSSCYRAPDTGRKLLPFEKQLRQFVKHGGGGHNDNACHTPPAHTSDTFSTWREQRQEEEKEEQRQPVLLRHLKELAVHDVKGWLDIPKPRVVAEVNALSSACQNL